MMEAEFDRQRGTASRILRSLLWPPTPFECDWTCFFSAAEESFKEQSSTLLHDDRVRYELVVFPEAVLKVSPPITFLI